MQNVSQAESLSVSFWLKIPLSLQNGFSKTGIVLQLCIIGYTVREYLVNCNCNLSNEEKNRPRHICVHILKYQQQPKQSNIQIQKEFKAFRHLGVLLCQNGLRYRECLVSSSDGALPTGCSFNGEIQKSGSTRL